MKSQKHKLKFMSNVDLTPEDVQNKSALERPGKGAFIEVNGEPTDDKRSRINPDERSF